MFRDYFIPLTPSTVFNAQTSLFFFGLFLFLLISIISWLPIRFIIEQKIMKKNKSFYIPRIDADSARFICTNFHIRSSDIMAFSKFSTNDGSDWPTNSLALPIPRSFLRVEQWREDDRGFEHTSVRTVDDSRTTLLATSSRLHTFHFLYHGSHYYCNLILGFACVRVLGLNTTPETREKSLRDKMKFILR